MSTKVKFIPIFCLHNSYPLKIKDELITNLSEYLGLTDLTPSNKFYDFYILLTKSFFEKTENNYIFSLKTLICSTDEQMIPVLESHIRPKEKINDIFQIIGGVFDIFCFENKNLDILQFDSRIYDDNEIEHLLEEWKKKHITQIKKK